MKQNRLFLIITLFVILFTSSAQADDYYTGVDEKNKTIGGTIFGSIQLVDTTPVVDPGIGGGLFFDYRFNSRFSITLESFWITQDGTGRSQGEGSVEFLGIPTTTFKYYPIGNQYIVDPYFGIGIGFYALTEGKIKDNSFGMGLGAQIEIGMDYALTNQLSLGVGGTYRSIGMLNSLSGTANATTYMPYTLFGRIGYRF